MEDIKFQNLQLIKLTVNTKSGNLFLAKIGKVSKITMGKARGKEFGRPGQDYAYEGSLN